MSTCYDPQFCQLARETAKKQNFTLREGVYIGLSGPSFETPAEVRMMRTLGADAVGMSTTSEVVVARHAGMRVMGLSVITNLNIDTPGTPDQTSHEDVLAMGRSVAVNAVALLRGVLSSVGAG
jgi:purine-nucleoside phosphorylase